MQSTVIVVVCEAVTVMTVVGGQVKSNVVWPWHSNERIPPVGRVSGVPHGAVIRLTLEGMVMVVVVGLTTTTPVINGVLTVAVPVMTPVPGGEY